MAVNVYKNRTNVLRVRLGYDVSLDTFESEIRETKVTGSPLIATWGIEFETDGTDGDLLLTLDDSLSDLFIDKRSGYMDLKRITGGEPLEVFGAPLKVAFKDTVTE